MTLLLYHSRTRPTGALLGRVLGVPADDNREGWHPDPLIRWGSQAGVGITPRRTLNYRRALRLASDKVSFLFKAKEANLPVPRVGYEPPSYPCLARRNGSSGGRGIQYLDAPREHEACDFYSEYIPVGREFRAHVYNEQCIAVQEKVLDAGLPEPQGFIPRNSTNGYVFKLKSTRYYPVPAALGVAAARIAGLHFGAVDMVTDANTGMMYVLEVNSAPAIEGTILLRYANYMAADLGIEVSEYATTYMMDYQEEDDESLR